MSNIVFSRRRFLATAVLALPLGTMAKAGEPTSVLTPQQRQQFVFERRRAAAQTELNDTPPSPVTNGDEERYVDRRAGFSKTMAHNELGEGDATAYLRGLAILAGGDPAQVEHVAPDPTGVERLNNPQATYAIDLVGPDATALTLEPPPEFASQAMAAEMTELYWRALMRDVPFREYDSNPLVPAAIADLGALGYGQLSTTSLFRGETAGDRRGPLVSQFLWRDIPYGLQTIEQRYRVPQPGQDFLTTSDEWLDCQRGGRARTPTRFDPTPRYIASYRALGEYVHRDFSFQPFMNAALIILQMGGERGDAVLSPTNPYRGSHTQFGDISFGNKNLLSLLAQASLLGQKTSYYQKWQVHRRGRPEAFGARIDVHVSGRKSYDLYPAILESDGVARTKARFGSWLLP